MQPLSKKAKMAFFDSLTGAGTSLLGCTGPTVCQTAAGLRGYVANPAYWVMYSW